MSHALSYAHTHKHTDQERQLPSRQTNLALGQILAGPCKTTLFHTFNSAEADFPEELIPLNNLGWWYLLFCSALCLSPANLWQLSNLQAAASAPQSGLWSMLELQPWPKEGRNCDGLLMVFKD